MQALKQFVNHQPREFENANYNHGMTLTTSGATLPVTSYSATSLLNR